MKKTILITGITGFVGSHLADYINHNHPDKTILGIKRWHLSKLDNSKSDIGLCFDSKIFETGTSNLIFVKNKSLYSPTSKFYKGITYKFFKSKIKNIINKDILISSLKEFDEIILIGSGKGVASVKTIDQIKWKRKSLKFYNKFSKYYLSAINNYPIYK